MRISIQQFLDALPAVATPSQGWRMQGDTKMIRNRDGACPVCALTNFIKDEHQQAWHTAADIAAKEANLQFLVHDVVFAADNVLSTKKDRELREAMIAILNPQ